MARTKEVRDRSAALGLGPARMDPKIAHLKIPQRRSFKAPKKPMGARKTYASKAPAKKPTRKAISYNYEADKAPLYRGATTGPAKLIKTKAGMNALREIRHYQRTTGLLLRKLSFQRIVREIMVQVEGPTNTTRPDRIQAQALHILQEATEAFGVHLMEASNLMAIHCKRVTIQQKDLQIAFQVTRILAPYIKTIENHIAKSRR